MKHLLVIEKVEPDDGPCWFLIEEAPAVKDGDWKWLADTDEYAEALKIAKTRAEAQSDALLIDFAGENLAHWVNRQWIHCKGGHEDY